MFFYIRWYTLWFCPSDFLGTVRCDKKFVEKAERNRSKKGSVSGFIKHND